MMAEAIRTRPSVLNKSPKNCIKSTSCSLINVWLTRKIMKNIAPIPNKIKISDFVALITSVVNWLAASKRVVKIGQNQQYPSRFAPNPIHSITLPKIVAVMLSKKPA